MCCQMPSMPAWAQRGVAHAAGNHGVVGRASSAPSTFRAKGFQPFQARGMFRR
jgi:hypothetical protein